MKKYLCILLIIICAGCAQSKYFQKKDADALKVDLTKNQVLESIAFMPKFDFTADHYGVPFEVLVYDVMYEKEVENFEFKLRKYQFDKGTDVVDTVSEYAFVFDQGILLERGLVEGLHHNSGALHSGAARVIQDSLRVLKARSSIYAEQNSIPIAKDSVKIDVFSSEF